MVFLRHPAESRGASPRRSSMLRSEILRSGRRETFSQGELIVGPAPDNKVRVVRRGYIKLFQTHHNGTNRIITFLGEGSMLGPFANHQDVRVPPVMARASSPLVHTVSWGWAAFDHLMRENPSIASMVRRSAAVKMQILLRRLSSLAFDPPRMRVAACLLELAEAHGRPLAPTPNKPQPSRPAGTAPRSPDGGGSPGETGHGRRIPFQLTQTDLAHMAAVTRPTAGKIMSELRRTGILAKRRGFYEIYDVEALAETLARGGA